MTENFSVMETVHTVTHTMTNNIDVQGCIAHMTMRSCFFESILGG